MNPLAIPPGQSTRNWFITVKVLFSAFSGWSQSM